MQTTIPILDTLTKRNLVTTDGAAWFQNALNPFPDYPESPAGVPDDNSAHTATKVVQKSITVTAPSLITPPYANDTWTATVWLMPIDTAGYPFYQATISPSNVENPTAYPIVSPDNQPGVLMVVKHWDGTPGNAFPWSPDFVPGFAEITGIQLADSYITEGAGRLTSAAYEITDNTPQLYAGGNMTNWRKSAASTAYPTLITDSGGFSLINSDVRTFPGMPGSQAEAFRIPGSTNTPFKEGSYVVGAFDNYLSEFELGRPYGGAVISRFSYSSPQPGLYAGFRVANVPYGDPSAYIPTPFVFTHLQHAGSVCTGLQQQVVFTLSFKGVIEILPNAASVLIDFVRPHNKPNPRLMEAYQQVANLLPPSVSVSENAAGDWFRKIISIATPILSKAFPGSESLINMGSKLATKGVDVLQARRQKKVAARAASKQQNQQQMVLAKKKK